MSVHVTTFSDKLDLGKKLSEPYMNLANYSQETKVFEGNPSLYTIFFS